MNKILGYNIDTPDCAIKLKDDGSGFGLNTTTYSNVDDFYNALTANNIQLTDNVRIDVALTDLSSNVTHYPGLLLCDNSGENYSLWYFNYFNGYSNVPNSGNIVITVYSFYTHTPK